jgi:hypothetical protein
MFLAASTHPYIAIMVFAILVTSQSLTRRWVAIAGSVVIMAGTFWIFGYLSRGGLEAGGFDLYSADLLTFINPVGLSSFIPTIRMSPAQGEGYAYLGLGMFALGMATGLGRKKLRIEPLSKAAFLPLWICTGAMAFYALSSHVSIAGHTIFTIEWFYRPFHLITGSFRSCGRFIWPFYYLLFICLIVRLCRARAIRRNQITAILIITLLIQTIDLGKAFHRQREPSGGFGPKYQVTESIWRGVGKEFHEISFPQIQLPEGAKPDLDSLKCSPGIYPPAFEFSKLVMVAFYEGMVLDHGLTAHPQLDLIGDECEQRLADLRQSALKPGFIYVLSEGVYRVVKKTVRARCGIVDGIHLCVAERSRDDRGDGNALTAFERALTN